MATGYAGFSCLLEFLFTCVPVEPANKAQDKSVCVMRAIILKGPTGCPRQGVKSAWASCFGLGEDGMSLSTVVPITRFIYCSNRMGQVGVLTMLVENWGGYRRSSGIIVRVDSASPFKHNVLLIYRFITITQGRAHYISPRMVLKCIFLAHVW